MNEIRIKIVKGEAVKAAVDEFYKKNGSKGTVRKDDLFFIAYAETQIVGCVRFCIEEGVPMLRTMYIDSSCRRLGVGRSLLLKFGEYLEQNEIKNVYCLPYPHLANFYGIINFKTVEDHEVPRFLLNRAIGYAQNGIHTIFMRRK